MLPASLSRLESTLPDDAVVLDVGGWGKPLARADWVVDLMPYDTRGLYGRDGEGPERFDADTWILLDICDHTPWPFEDDQFDFAVCSHTLEDIRDPVWVCRELSRVAKAGYIEVPSRLEEQSPLSWHPGVGWSHHRWLVDIDQDAAHVDFVFKHGVVYTERRFNFPVGFQATLSEAERVSSLWWEGSLTARERVFVIAAELNSYLEEFVAGELAQRGIRRKPPKASLPHRLRKRLNTSR